MPSVMGAPGRGDTKKSLTAGGSGHGTLGHWWGGYRYGEGSDAQKLLALGGGLGGAVIGGWISVRGGQWLTRNQIKVDRWGVRIVPRLRQGDIELAQTTGATHEQIAARTRVVKVFAEEAGVSPKQLKNLIGEKGDIDLDIPVMIRPFKAGETALQWSVPGKPPGNWVSLVDEHPSRLGISPEGRVQQVLRMDKNGLALENGAKSIIDDWTISARPYPAQGGGTQLFIPNKYKSISPVGESIKTWRDIPFYPD